MSVKDEISINKVCDIYNDEQSYNEFKNYTLKDFPKLIKLRNDHRKAEKRIFTERTKAYTDYFRENGFEYKDMILSQALALDKVLSTIPVPIFDDELIAGSTTKHKLGCLLFPEFSGMTIFSELPVVSRRKFDPIKITDEEVFMLAQDVFPFWKDRCVLEYVRREGNNPRSNDLLERLVFYLLAKAHGISHIAPYYESLVNRGMRDIINEACQKAESADSHEKKVFYQAIKVSLEAVIKFAGRYKAECQRLAKDSSPDRAKELNTMAENLSVVPEYKPESYHQALQSIWITQVALHQENVDAALSFGRLDKILYPFYRHDIESGILTRKSAAHITGSFFIKMQDHTPLVPESGQDVVGGSGTSQAVTLGGLFSDGSDSTNELSFLMLKMTSLLALREPNLCARVHNKCSSFYWKAITDAIYESGAMPAIFNDDVIIPAMNNKGISIEDSRDYALIGCVENTSAGRTMGHTGAIVFNLCACLEMALYNGIHPLSGLQIGPETGNFTDFNSYDEFFDAFQTQLKFLSDMAVDGNSRFAQAHKELHPTPLLSSLIDGTMDKAKDVTDGGAKYNSSGVAIIGFADTVDSLTAIKKLVFEENKISKTNLINALKTDFKGYEKVFAMLKNKVPKYGQDDDIADTEAHVLVKLIEKTFDRHKNPRGGFFSVGYWSITMHAGLGALTGALPCGKRKGESFASGATPGSGSSTKGPTAALCSTAKLPYMSITNGIANNHKISRDLLSQPDKMDIFSKLIQGFSKKGGIQVQFIIQNKEVLIDAMNNPDKYRDLLVRVSGYTAYFCDLNKKMQQEIISRAEDII